MSNLLRALAALAALAGTYAAVSVWAHPLPYTVPVLVTAAVCALAFHFTFQLAMPHHAAPATRPACPVHGDTVACPCALAAVTFDTLPLDTV
jgi:hypothetical protein